MLALGTFVRFDKRSFNLTIDNEAEALELGDDRDQLKLWVSARA